MAENLHSVPRAFKRCLIRPFLPASEAQLDARATGDQEVAGSTPAESATFIMKYFLQSFSPFR